jgi:uncharacterized protein YprB with RNaseH-like and TPR domain
MIEAGTGKKRDPMAIKDELKLLKKERDARDRSRKVHDTWQKIDRDGENLTTKEKLERLISLTRREKGPAGKPEPAPVEPGHREPVQFFENPYTLGARYGQVTISLGLEIPGKALALLSHDAAFEGLSLDSALFLDLETTGLAGGTGTLPFLVGMGYYRNGRFNVAQYFLSEMGDEDRMIRELGQFFREMGFKSVVTYNGKAFDMPLLETRFALQRERFPLAGLPHLDFLFSARHLWKHRYESCRLSYLAREIVRADRDEDIPGAEIPIRYFQYIRSGDFSLIEPILYHNQEDILSLLGVVIEGALLFDRGRRPSQDETDAMDLVGIGRLYESAGDLERSIELFEKALEGELSGEVSVHVRTKLGRHFKKNRAWDKAVSLWQGAAGCDELSSRRELAMYYEHREKKYEEAIRAAEEGLAWAMGVSLSYEQDFRKRLERLKGKVRRRQEKSKK